jgi:predicted DNA-binding transcriptional regulator AlpA
VLSLTNTGLQVNDPLVPQIAEEIGMATLSINTTATAIATFPELLTAELLGVSAATVSRWGASREHGENVGPPCYTLSDRVRRWYAAEVRAWLKQVRR